MTSHEEKRESAEKKTPDTQESAERQGQQAVEGLVQDLLSSSYDRRDKAVITARELAKVGDQRGLLALEEAIRIKSGRSQCTFYQPGFRVRPAQEIFQAKSEILDLARRGRLLENTEKTGELLTKLGFVLGSSYERWHDLILEIKSVGGEDQAHAFQLLGTHLQVSSQLIMIARRQQDRP
jgi:hypothetical protein